MVRSGTIISGIDGQRKRRALARRFLFSFGSDAQSLFWEDFHHPISIVKFLCSTFQYQLELSAISYPLKFDKNLLNEIAKQR